MSERERVTGIGGIFHRAKDADALRAFYRDHLGVEIEEYGGTAFAWRDPRDFAVTGQTVWSVFKDETDYFAPSTSRVMVNFRVSSLDRMLVQLRAAGVTVDDKVDDSEFGRFGWAHDPEGNKIELWEPPPTEKHGLSYWVVDAFTDLPFAGNPAAVCPLVTWLDDRTMFAIAKENALSETAFFVRRDGGAPDAAEYDLRWFTPRIEVELCGHATLASAHVVLGTLVPKAASVVFHTKSGPLTVERAGNALAMNFPARAAEPVASPDSVISALGAAPRETLRSGDTLVCIMDSPATVRTLAPDLKRVAALDASGVIVTAKGGGEGLDFVSRYFAPNKGVPEDPVTGSAHCVLAPMWSARLAKTTLRARQVSERGGELTCEVRGARVVLTGHAVTVKRGVLLTV